MQEFRHARHAAGQRRNPFRPRQRIQVHVQYTLRALGGRQVAPFADTDYARLYVVSVGLFSRTTVTELALP